MIRVYQLLLLCYPPSLRRVHGAEMTTAFAEWWRTRRTVGERLELVVALLFDFVTSLPREWRAASGPGPARPPQREHPHMTHLIADIKQGLLLFRQAPWFVLGAVLTLGLGIGATTAIVSLANATLVDPLPIDNPDEVYQSTWTWSYPDFRDLEADQQVFSDIAAWSGVSFAHERGARTSAVSGLAVSGGYFALTGIAPIAGRLIDSNDDREGAAPVVVLSERFWRRDFGADPAILGTTIHLSSRPVTVVGISPRRFRGLSLRDSPEVFVAAAVLPQVGTGILASADMQTRRNNVWLQVVGRLRHGVSADAARAATELIYRRNRPPNPNRIEEPVVLEPLLARALGVNSAADLRTFIALLAAAAAAGLLLACATVANLLLVRTAGRRRELAIRAALGGGQRRLMQMVLVESLIIGCAGSLAGLATARVTLNLLAAYSLPGNIPVSDLTLSLDARQLLVAVGAGILTSLAFGAAPLWQASRVQPAAALGHGVRSSPRQPLRSVLVGVQVAVCVMLLAGGLAFGRALQHALAVDLGFDTANTAMVEVDTAMGRLSQERAAAFQREVLDRVGQAPGILAAWSTLRPATGVIQWDVSVPNPVGPISRDISERAVVANAVSEDYFAVMGIPLSGGRSFTASDTLGAPPVAIVSEAMAQRYWPDRSPLGEVLTLGGTFDPDDTATVVGVVGDIQRGVMRRTEPMIYLSMAQRPGLLAFGSQTLLVRGDAGMSPAGAASRAASLIGEVDPTVPVTGVETIAQHLGGTLMAHRLGVTLFTLFSALAMLLTGLGLYAVVTYAVANRRKEIGIRVALGAPARSVLALTARQGLLPIVLGVVAGSLGALLGASLIERFMFSLPAFDVGSFVLLVLTIGALGIGAMLVPARRALAVEPTVALRD